MGNGKQQQSHSPKQTYATNQQKKNKLTKSACIIGQGVARKHFNGNNK